MTRLWDKLTAPGATLPHAQHLQARLLSASLLALLVTVMAAVAGLSLQAATHSSWPSSREDYIWLTGMAFVSLLYGVSRTRRYLFAARIFVIAAVVLPLAAAFAVAENTPSRVMSLAALSLLGVLSAAILLGRGASLLAAAVAVGVTVVLPVLNPEIDLAAGRWVVLFMLAMSGLTTVAAHQRVSVQAQSAQSERARWLEQGARQEVMRSALDAVLIMDAGGVIRGWNPSAEELFGWPSSVAVGKCLADVIIPPRFRVAHQRGLERFLRTGRGRMSGRRVELTALHANGHTLPIEVAMLPIQTPEGGTLFWAFVRDLTEQREIEEQLARARDKALEGSRLKSEFLANMSHEIRTPMNGVIGMTGLLLDTNLTHEQREYAETVRACGDSLLAVINDILDFSKVEAGHLALEVVDFDVRSTVEASLQLLASKAQERGLELICSVSPFLHTAVAGDPGRLRQVIINLVDNAIKFTTRGHVMVRIDSTSSDAEGEESDHHVRLKVEVHDTGIGIEPALAGRLFQPFTQADMSTTRRFGGTGLGLSICKQIIELMQGSIQARPNPEGPGSVFSFEVSLRRRSPQVDNARKALDEIGAAGRQALVVMDSEPARHALMSDIGTFGLEADGAASVEEAKRSIFGRTRPYDVALVDHQLGGEDSAELLRWMRVSGSRTPTIVLVDRTRRGQARRKRQEGGGYLTKPVRRVHLADRLHSVLRSERSRGVRLAPISKPMGRADSARRPRVLVADDNATNARLTVHMLGHLGYRSLVVADGREALDALKRAAYAAVIMDCHMPVMDGFEATRDLRRREGEAGVRTPVIALTANAHPRTRQQCLDAGMDDYLTKPVTYEALKGVLDRFAPLTVADESPRVLDRAALAAIVDLQQPGTPDLLCELLTLYLAQSREALAVLRAAAAAADSHRLAFKAHELKSSSASLGAHEVAQLFGRLEELGRSGSVSGVRTELDRLERELARTWNAMELLMAERGAAFSAE